MLQVYTCNEREKKDFFFLTKMSACFSSVEVCQKRERQRKKNWDMIRIRGRGNVRPKRWRVWIIACAHFKICSNSNFCLFTWYGCRGQKMLSIPQFNSDNFMCQNDVIPSSMDSTEVTHATTTADLKGTPNEEPSQFLSVGLVVEGLVCYKSTSVSRDTALSLWPLCA